MSESSSKAVQRAGERGDVDFMTDARAAIVQESHPYASAVLLEDTRHGISGGHHY